MTLQWRELEDEERRRVEEVYRPPSTIRDLVRFEDGVLLPRLFVTDNWAERIRNFELRKDDIWILSYPKTGTTWTIELVWMLINDLKFETADIPEHLRCPIMEGASVITCDFLQSQGMKPEDPEGGITYSYDFSLSMSQSMKNPFYSCVLLLTTL